jgi:protein gp37
MSENTKIEWCDHTFNPWQGCTKVSPGCLHCYAETRDRRHLIEKVDHWGKGAPRLRTSAANWKAPLKWNAEAHRVAQCPCGFRTLNWGRECDFNETNVAVCPRCGGVGALRLSRPRVFSASMADWLDDEVPIEWLADFLALIHATPHLDWLLLTKRPENWRTRVAAAMLFNGQRGGGLCTPETKSWMHAYDRDWKWLHPEQCMPGCETPPANVWIGTTVEDQTRADERIPALLKIPASVRFLSCEPLLEHVFIRPEAFEALQWEEGQPSIQWVICGGESGPGARPMHPDWARSLRDQCAAAGVPFFFKQWGEWVSVWDSPDGKSFESCAVTAGGEKCSVFSMPAGAAQFARVGKKAAGRLLDGVEHSAFPNG